MEQIFQCQYKISFFKDKFDSFFNANVLPYLSKDNKLAFIEDKAILSAHLMKGNSECIRLLSKGNSIINRIGVNEFRLTTPIGICIDKHNENYYIRLITNVTIYDDNGVTKYNCGYTVKDFISLCNSGYINHNKLIEYLLIQVDKFNYNLLPNIIISNNIEDDILSISKKIADMKKMGKKEILFDEIKKTKSILIYIKELINRYRTTVNSDRGTLYINSFNLNVNKNELYFDTHFISEKYNKSQLMSITPYSLVKMINKSLK